MLTYETPDSVQVFRSAADEEAMFGNGHAGRTGSVGRGRGKACDGFLFRVGNIEQHGESEEVENVIDLRTQGGYLDVSASLPEFLDEGHENAQSST